MPNQTAYARVLDHSGVQRRNGKHLHEEQHDRRGHAAASIDLAVNRVGHRVV